MRLKIAIESMVIAHFPYELLLSLWAKVAVDGGLDLEKVLDHVFQVVFGLVLAT